MATLKEAAQAYVPPQKPTVADLDRLSVDMDVKTKTDKNRKGEEYTFNYIEVGGKEYRIAGSVLSDIKELLKKFPNLKYVSVIKSGEGQSTRYQIVPLLQEGGKA